VIIGKAHNDPEDAKRHLSQLAEVMRAFGTIAIALETPNYPRNQLIFNRLTMLSNRKIEDAAGLNQCTSSNSETVVNYIVHYLMDIQMPFFRSKLSCEDSINNGIPYHLCAIYIKWH